MTTTSPAAIDLSTIDPALGLAKARLRDLSIISGTISGTMRELLENLEQRMAPSELKTAIAGFQDARKNMLKIARAQWQGANDSAQALALGFLSAATGQILPGNLTLPGERGCSETIQVNAVDYFHANEDGWSANLNVQTSPHCFTTRTVYLTKQKTIEWLTEVDF